MLLQNKTAVVYGGAGSIGGAVARAFAREGARVFLAGRTQSTLDKVAADLAGAQTAQVDALDEAAVEAFTSRVAEQTGGIDICFNAIGIQDVQKPLMEITAEEFAQPVAVATRTQFLTTRAAVRHMIGRGSGVILMYGGSGPQTMPGLGGLKVALDAMEGIRRQWAHEVGRHGIRVVTMITGGIPESVPDDHPAKEQITEGIRADTLLGREAKLADVGDVAAFIASDKARTMTSATVNISAGAIVDY